MKIRNCADGYPRPSMPGEARQMHVAAKSINGLSYGVTSNTTPSPFDPPMSVVP